AENQALPDERRRALQELVLPGVEEGLVAEALSRHLDRRRPHRPMLQPRRTDAEPSRARRFEPNELSVASVMPSPPDGKRSNARIYRVGPRRSATARAIRRASIPTSRRLPLIGLVKPTK